MRTKNERVRNLQKGDEIKIPLQDAKIISITPLKHKYNTEIQAKVLEVELVGQVMKGKKFTIILEDADRVQMTPRPGFFQRLFSKSKAKAPPKKPAKKQGGTQKVVVRFVPPPLQTAYRHYYYGSHS